MLLLLVAAVLLSEQGVSARGRVFQRFSPELLANLGYGGGGGGGAHMGMYRDAENMIEEEPYAMELLKKPCYGMRCTSNDYCCPGTVCDWDGSNFGRCVFVRGRRLGELCRRDADCDSGLVCGLTEGSLVSVCSVPLSLPKQYNEECETSTDCDVSRGLCCQLQRRHRQQHRKACAYFQSPMICIGNVAAEQVRHHPGLGHLSGAEKRLID